MSAGLIAGTAGVYTSTNAPLVTAVTVRPLIQVVPRNERKVAALQPILNRIKVAFGLTMTEMADVFGVSRPTVYAWFSGTTPKGELLDRVWDVHRAAEAICDLRVARVDLLKRKPLSSGLNLLQALNQGGLMLDNAVEEVRRDASSSILRRTEGERRRPHRIYTAGDVSTTQHDEL